MDFLCDLCGVAKITKFDLKEHQRRAHDERNFNCPECNATFVGQNKLQSHLQTHRRRTCSDCGLEITKKSHKCKTKEKQIFSCEKCNLKTTYRNNLYRHKATCQKEKMVKPKKHELKHLTEATHSRLRIHDERHGYTIIDKGSEAHWRKQHTLN